MIGVSHVKGHIDHTPPPVGSPIYFENIGSSNLTLLTLTYIGTLSFAYIAYRAGKVVYNQLR